MKRKKLVYWDTGKSTFVKKDLEILSSEYIVRDFTLDATYRWMLPFQLVYQLFHSLINVSSSVAVIVQFAGVQSYVPFLVAGWLGRKRIIVAGGTDCVAFPSISYGNFQRKYVKWFTRKSFEMADLILPVDQTLIDYEYTYTESDYPRQGYRNFTGEIKAREVVIYNGYDSDFWKPRDVVRKPKSFITVGANLHSRFAFRLKGIDMYLELARRMPDCVFAIVGGRGIDKSIVPSNVELLPNQDNKKLPELLSQYEYYAQLSMSEGFPNALTEAMLCGCVPVVSNVGAMPMIAGDDACILKKKDPDALEKLVRGLLAQTNKADYRQRVEKYTYSSRKMKMLSELEQLFR